MHLTFKYMKNYIEAITLYNSLKSAGKEAYMSYDPKIGMYYVRFY